ncbi:hypothetical protein ACLKA7_004391 [Drosophila subpalustris]
MITKGRERQQRGVEDKDRLMLLLLLLTLTISAETDEVNNDAGDDEPYYVTLSLPRSRASSSETRVINVARHVTDACDYAAVYLPPSPSLNHLHVCLGNTLRSRDSEAKFACARNVIENASLAAGNWANKSICRLRSSRHDHDVDMQKTPTSVYSPLGPFCLALSSYSNCNLAATLVASVWH